MAYKLDGKMVIGVSSRALFDLNDANAVFEAEGVESYRSYQKEHENDILKPGPGFSLVKALLDLNKYCSEEDKMIEVIIMSRNSPDTSLRVFNSIKHYDLDIVRAVLTSGASLAPYLNAFHVDLFLSAYEDDVQSAINGGIAAGIICTDKIDSITREVQEKIEDTLNNGEPLNIGPGPIEQIRIAFDGDAVLFDPQSEAIYQHDGLKAFSENEEKNAELPMQEGPFAQFLRKLSDLQKRLGGVEDCPIRTALVTSRSAPAHERVIRTLRAWDVRLDEAFFLGGIEKKDFLKAFGAQIFFDDQVAHTGPASSEVPSARVPYKDNCDPTV